jgi:hypothetical protein
LTSAVSKHPGVEGGQRLQRSPHFFDAHGLYAADAVGAGVVAEAAGSVVAGAADAGAAVWAGVVAAGCAAAGWPGGGPVVIVQAAPGKVANSAVKSGKRIV